MKTTIKLFFIPLFFLVTGLSFSQVKEVSLNYSDDSLLLDFSGQESIMKYPENFEKSSPFSRLYEKNGPFDIFRQEDEILENRTLYSKEFQYRNEKGEIDPGQKTVVITAGQMHYPDSEGLLRTITDDIEKNNSNINRNYKYAALNNRFKTYFGEQNSFGILMTFEDHSKIEFMRNPEFSFLNSNKQTTGEYHQLQYSTPRQKDHQTIQYDDLFGEQLSGTVQQLMTGFESSYIIHNESFFNNIPIDAQYIRFTEEIKLPSGNYLAVHEYDKETQEILIFNETRELTGEYSSPIIYDAKGKEKGIMAEYEIEQIDNMLLVHIIIPVSYFTSGECIYPVVIDPTWQAGNTANWTGTVYRDDDGDKGCTSSDEIRLGFEDITWPGDNKWYSGWATFNLTSVNTSCGIQSHYLRAYRYSASGGNIPYRTGTFNNQTMHPMNWSCSNRYDNIDWPTNSTTYSNVPPAGWSNYGVNLNDILARLGNTYTCAFWTDHTWDPSGGTGDDSKSAYFRGRSSSNRPQLVLNVVTPPVAGSVSVSDNLICPGESVTFTVAGSSYFDELEYQWDGTGGSWISWGSTNPHVWSSTNAGHTIYVRSVATNGSCTVYSGAISCTVLPVPATGVTASVNPVCQNATSVLNASASGGTSPYTFSWNNSLPDGASNSVSPDVNTTYNVTATDANGCTSSASVSVDVLPAPNIAISTIQPDCNGDCDGSASVSVTGGIPPYSYSWSNGSSGANISGLCAGTYQVTVTDGNGCMSDGSEDPITSCFEITDILVNSCGGVQEGEQEMVTIRIGASDLNTGDLFIDWPNNSWLGVCTDPAFVANTNATITGGGQLIEPVGGVLPASSEVLIVTSTAHDNSALDFSNLDHDVYVVFQCAGNTNGHFANSNSSPSAARTLDISFGGSCQDMVTYYPFYLNNSDGESVSFNSNGDWTTYNNGCTAPVVATTVAEITEPPALNISAGNNGPVCEGQPLNLTSSPSGYSSYNWSGPSSFSSSSEDPTVNSNATISNAGTYTVNVENSSGCTASAQTIVSINPAPTSTTDITICDTDLPYNWNGLTFNAAGTQTATLVSTAGCDSIATLNLTVNPTQTSTTEITICETDLPYNWNGLTFNAAGVQTSTLVSVAGCDSIATLKLTVNPTQTSTTDITICETELPYTWNGLTFNAAGTQNATLVSAAGCDSIATLNLTVNPTQTSTTDITICETDLPYNWNGLTFNAAGAQTATLVSTAGCDSIATLNLMVNPTQTSTTDITICETELPYIWNGLTFNAAGTQNATLLSAEGCDSIATLNLTVNPTQTSTTDITICETDLPYTWNGLTFNAAGTQNATLVSAEGCDSTATLNLTVNPTQMSTTDITICETDLPYNWNGLTFNAAGVQTATLVSTAGCDSIATLNLTVNPTQTSTTDITICETDLPYNWNGLTFNAAGAQTATLVSTTGCDSIATLNLTVNPTQTSTTDITICETELPYIWNGLTFNATGAQNATLVSAAGCDSIATLNLTVNPIQTSTTDITICETDLPYNWNGLTFNAAGAQTATLVSTAGCDSIATLNLTVNPTQTSTTDITICETELPYIWNGLTFNAAGTQNATLVSAAGCDSIATLNLTVNTTQTSTTDITICETELPYIWNGLTFNAAGTQNATLVSAAGCDSIATLDLMVNPTQTSTTDITICETELPYNWNGLTFNAAGAQTATLVSTAGCDSIATLNLTVEPSPAIQIISSNDPLCHGDNTGNILVSSPGSPSAIFNWSGFGNGPELNNIGAGNYTVEATGDNGCTNSITVQLNDPQSLNVEINSVEPVSCHGNNDGQIIILSSGGTGNYSYEWSNGSSLPVLSNISGGTYDLTVTDSNGCESYESIYVSEPTPLELEPTVENVICGLSTGSCTIVATGGNGGYQYSWDGYSYSGSQLTGLSAGIYTVTVEDSEHCSAQASMTINTSGYLNVSIQELSPVTCFGESNAILRANVNNPLGDVDYLWTPSGTEEPEVYNLGSGIASVQVSDEYGCNGNASYMVEAPSPIALSYETFQVRCKGESDGSIAVYAGGGSEPYTYMWLTQGYGQTIDNLGVGWYHLTVTDSHNCIITDSIFLNEPENTLDLSVNVTDITCYGEKNGELDANVSGGTPPYNYEWVNGNESYNNDALSGLPSGIFSLNVTDETGCSIDTLLVVEEPSPLMVSYVTINPTCYGNHDGSIDFEIIGGIEPYSIIWENGINNIPYLDGLYEGSYDIIIQDNNGCKYELNTITLMDSPEECIRIPNAFTPNMDGVNDSWHIENFNMYPEAKVKVYNRWGQVIYFGQPGSEEWNGTDLNGDFVPAGSYIYIINLYNGSEAKSGTVTVVY